MPPPESSHGDGSLHVGGHINPPDTSWNMHTQLLYLVASRTQLCTSTLVADPRPSLYNILSTAFKVDARAARGIYIEMIPDDRLTVTMQRKYAARRESRPLGYAARRLSPCFDGIVHKSLLVMQPYLFQPFKASSSFTPFCIRCPFIFSLQHVQITTLLLLFRPLHFCSFYIHLSLPVTHLQHAGDPKSIMFQSLIADLLTQK
jgi:hypothetical protein